MKKNVLFLFLLLLLLPIPFLSSDPDHEISFSRDAFTDEGLYASQVRNYLLTGDFNLNESDAAIKTPLYSLVILTAFKIGGIHLLTIRLMVLVISILMFLYVFRDDFILSLLMMGLTFFQFTVFHYTHLALAEILAVACLTVGWYLLSKFKLNDFKFTHIIFSCGIVALAMYLKFQYLFMMTWIPLFFVLVFCYSLFVNFQKWKSNATAFILIVAGTVVFLVIYYFIWYLPNRELFDFVIKSQTTVVFGEGEWFRKMIDFNIENFFMNSKTAPFTWLFLVCVLIFPYILYKFRSQEKRVFQFLAIFSWCLLELHKPALAYLPGRYLVSTFFSMGLFSALMLRSLYDLIPSNYIRVPLLVLAIGWPFYANIIAYRNSYQNRSYLLAEANSFVEKYHTPGCYIAGPWAPSVAWLTSSPAVPVWKDYFNYENTMINFKPCIIVSETGEEDSGNAWKSQNVDLAALSDTTSDFKIRDWHARIYILKSK